MEEFAEDIKVDLNDLKGEFIKQTAIHSKYGLLYTTSEYEEKMSKLELEVTTASLYLAKREEASEKGKVTEATIDALVKTTPEYIDAQRKYFSVLKNKAESKIMYDTVNQKKDMLLQLGALTRSEMENII